MMECILNLFILQQAHWTEYLYFPLIHEDQRQLSEQWAIKCFRCDSMRIKNKNIRHLERLSPGPDYDPIIRIKSQLQSYNAPIPAPPLIVTTENTFIDNITNLDSKAWKHIEKHLNSLAGMVQ